LSFYKWYKENIHLKYFQSKKEMIELYRTKTGVGQATAYSHYKKDRENFFEKKDGREVYLKLLTHISEEEKNELSIGSVERKEFEKLGKEEIAVEKSKNLTYFETKFCLNIIARFGLDFDTAYKITKTIEELE